MVALDASEKEESLLWWNRCVPLVEVSCCGRATLFTEQNPSDPAQNLWPLVPRRPQLILYVFRKREQTAKRLDLLLSSTFSSQATCIKAGLLVISLLKKTAAMANYYML